MGWTSHKCASVWMSCAVDADWVCSKCKTSPWPNDPKTISSEWIAFQIILVILYHPIYFKDPFNQQNQKPSVLLLFGNLAWVVCQWVWICLSFKVAQSRNCLFTKRIVIHVETLPNTLWLNKLQLSADQRHLAISMQRKESGLSYVVL